MKKIKKFIPYIIIVLIAIIFLSIPTIIFADTNLYYKTAKILLGLEELSNWPIVRGPSLALILYPFLKILGNNEFSIRICLCIFYLIMIITSYNFTKKETNNLLTKKENKTKIIVYSIYILLIVLNPIIFGYYHGILTEFAANTISIINLILITKINNKENISNKHYIKLLIYSCFIFTFSWFLKQPYFTISFFPYLTLLFLKLKNKNNRLKTTILFIVPIIFLILSINIWKNFLISKDLNYLNTDNNNFYISKAIIDGNSNYEKDVTREIYTIEGVHHNFVLTEEDRELILEKLENNDKKYIVYYVHNIKGEVIDTEVFTYKNERFTSIEALKFVLKAFVKHPIIVIDSYISNYLASINIYSTYQGGNYYRPYKNPKNVYGENGIIGLGFLSDIETNYKGLAGEEKITEEIEIKYNSIDKLGIIKLLGFYYLLLYKIQYLILPIFWLILLIKVLKNKRQYETSFIFINFVFMHSLFHIFMGAMIDRYIYITYPAYILGIICFILAIKNNKTKLSTKS